MNTPARPINELEGFEDFKSESDEETTEPIFVKKRGEKKQGIPDGHPAADVQHALIVIQNPRLHCLTSDCKEKSRWVANGKANGIP